MDKIVGEIQKTKNKKTLIGLSTFKGVEYIECRDYFKNDSMTDWAPTKKGTMIKTDKAPELVTIYEKVEDEIKKKGGK